MQTIRQTSRWKVLKLKTMPSLRYTNYKAPFQDEQRGIRDRFVGLHARDKDVFDEIPEAILRWRVSTRMSSSTLPNVAVRTHLRRRWKNALADMLKKKGYKLDGMKVVDGKKVSGLRGTLEVNVHKGLGLMNPYADLLKDAQTTIDAIEKMQLPVPPIREENLDGPWTLRK